MEPGGAPAGGPSGPRRPAAPAARKDRAPGRGENRPAPSLVYTTLLGRFEEPFDSETGEVVVRRVRGSIIDYPDGGGELSAFVDRRGGMGARFNAKEYHEHQHEQRVSGIEEADLRAEEREERRRETRSDRSRQESVRRARSRVRRIVRYYALTYMVTLTFPGDGEHDYNRALRYLQDFIHDHGDLLRLGGHYVAVPELHPSGHGWHWHVLVGRRFTRTELAALWQGWTDFLGRRGMEPSGGARFVRVDVKAWGSATRAAGYASKYAAKTFEQASVGKGRRRFLASQGADVEKQEFVARSVEEVADIVREVAPSALVIEVGSEEGRPPIVWAGWDA